jgi:hypothetical protein
MQILLSNCYGHLKTKDSNNVYFADINWTALSYASLLCGNKSIIAGLNDNKMKW